MKKIFLDSNILLDLLLDRIPESEWAEKVFVLAENNRLEIYCSALSISHLHYILRKVLGNQNALIKISNLIKIVRLTDISSKNIHDSIDSSFKDFEDAIQYHSALQIRNLDFIVTNNHNDFLPSKIDVITAKNFIKIYFPDI